MRRAILLINVGTPDKPEVRSVRKYLSEFLNDPKVIDLPWLARKLLVNLIIVPFRAPKSTKLYQRLWTKNGSPLLHYSQNLRAKLDESIGDSGDVFLAMRYGNPHLKDVLKEIQRQFYDQLIVLPLFPQYAESTTGTANAYVEATIQKWKKRPEIRYIAQFYEHPSFIKSFADNIQAANPQDYDHLVLSYHGLPNRHLDKSHQGIKSNSCECHMQMPPHGEFCYRATCYATSRALARKLGLKENEYTVSFQSRLSSNWMKPFTDSTLEELSNKGKQKVLIAAPAFVADCLETTDEIGHEYAQMFKKFGGKKLDLVPSLNDSDAWVNSLIEILDLPHS